MIAFDTATTTGYAYPNKDGWITGVFDPRDSHALIDVIKKAKLRGVKRAAIEDCYFGKNIKGLKTLQECQTRIAVACEAHNLPYAIIQPAQWQAAFGITGHRKDRKLGARRVALMLGAKCKTQDEADAVCLCEYAARNHIPDARKKVKA